MSRIGKLPIAVPNDVQVEINEECINITGKLGKLSSKYNQEVEISFDNQQNKIYVKPKKNTNKSRAMWGLYRSITNNMIKGVTEGFSKKLNMVGVGYKAEMNGKNLILFLGFSHNVIYAPEENIEIKCPTPVTILISGSDKQKVGQAAAIIRSIRPPEPYKGKGVQYDNEKINRKVGKKK